MSNRKTEGLKSLFLFQLLAESELEEICDIFYERIYAPNTKIFSEKDKGDSVYIIKTGSVGITREESGAGIELANLFAGDFFGEVTLFDYAFRTATATAKEESTILEITRAQFNTLFAEKPQIAAKILYQMMVEMSRRLRKKDEGSGFMLF